MAVPIRGCVDPDKTHSYRGIVGRAGGSVIKFVVGNYLTGAMGFRVSLPDSTLEMYNGRKTKNLHLNAGFREYCIHFWWVLAPFPRGVFLRVLSFEPPQY